MPGITIAYIHHPETFVHFFLQVFDNILYAGQNKITVRPAWKMETERARERFCPENTRKMPGSDE
jgi:hypothetical protein